MYASLRVKSEQFYTELLSSKTFLTFLLIYSLLKIFSNIYYGANYFTALRSGLIGLAAYLFGFYIINLFAKGKDKTDDFFKINSKVAKSSLIFSALYFLFLFVQIIDNLQRSEIISGLPILTYLPGYNWLITMISSNAPDQLEIIIKGSIFYILIPYVFLKLINYDFRGLLSLKNTRASWPILGIYTVLFLTNGTGLNKLGRLLQGILHPALSEEFFHRGIVFRAWANIVDSTALSLIGGSLLFSLIHFPTYYYTMYEGQLLMTIANMADTFITGMLWAYGFRKTGTLLPWILIHALSNMPFIM